MRLKSLIRLVFTCAALLNISAHGKFSGVSAGGSIGGNVSSLKGGSIKDTLDQWGGNTKVYLGIGKSILDLAYIGIEGFAEYNFLPKKDDLKTGRLESGAQFGGYVRAGFRPTENILTYGLFGYQTNTTSVNNILDALKSNSQSGWSSMVGIGVEYAIALGAAIRVEGIYIPEQKFELKDVPDMKFESDFISINVGVIVYL